MSKKKALKTAASEAKSIKASNQLRDAKGHFIKGYKTATTVAVSPIMEACSAITVVNSKPLQEEAGTWAKTMAEISDKLNVVIQGLGKLNELKDFIKGN